MTGDVCLSHCNLHAGRNVLQMENHISQLIKISHPCQIIKKTNKQKQNDATLFFFFINLCLNSKGNRAVNKNIFFKS